MSRTRGAKDKGPRNTLRNKLAQLADSKGITPLEMMIETAQFAWNMAMSKQASGATEDEVLPLLQQAAQQAERCAPYMHPRLAAETHRLINDDAKRPDADIKRELDEIAQATTAAATAARARAVAEGVPEKPNGVVH